MVKKTTDLGLISSRALYIVLQIEEKSAFQLRIHTDSKCHYINNFVFFRALIIYTHCMYIVFILYDIPYYHTDQFAGRTDAKAGPSYRCSESVKPEERALSTCQMTHSVNSNENTEERSLTA